MVRLVSGAVFCRVLSCCLLRLCTAVLGKLQTQKTPALASQGGMLPAYALALLCLNGLYYINILLLFIVPDLQAFALDFGICAACRFS